MCKEYEFEVTMMNAELAESYTEDFPVKGNTRGNRRNRTEAAKKARKFVDAARKAAITREEVTQGKGHKGDKVYITLPGYTRKGITVSVPKTEIWGADPIGRTRREGKRMCGCYKPEPETETV